VIAVTFALPAESSDFVRRLTGRRETPAAVHGRIGQHDVTVVYTGVGRAAATRQIAGFLKSEQPEWLISAGFAGGLNDRAAPGDLVIGANLSETGLRDRAQAALPGVPLLKIVTAETIIDRPEDRASFAQSSGADAIEMETAVIAEACAACGIPILSLRVVTDTPSSPFPAPPDVLFDVASQRTNIAQLAAYLATHPLRIPRLIGFAQRIARARRTLADALVEVLR
jgi:adenosylhomocysteine nucleosidase